MKYSIAKYTPNYYGNCGRIAPLYRNDDNIQSFAKTFETITEAQNWIQNYCSQDSEYFVADSDVIDYIGRDGDLSNYDWNDCNCDCGECSICCQNMMLQDLDMVKRAARITSVIDTIFPPKSE